MLGCWATSASTDIPVPSRFYVHDDISRDIRLRHGPDSEAYRLTEQLFDLIRRDAERVRVLTVEEQIEELVSRGEHAPFAMTIGIGTAGERVARQLHQRSGWFPSIQRIDLFREEDARGGYNLVGGGADSLGGKLSSVKDVPSLAVVDDTVFSGLTMRTVLGAMPPELLSRTHAFCLRCVGESRPAIEALCPISAGFAATGHILEDVSFINASGLVTRVGIRRANKPPLAFFDRPEWVNAWFPDYGTEVVELCKRLNALLEPGPT